MSRICRVLEKGQCEITQEYGNNHNAVDVVGANYTLDYVVAHSDGKVIFCQDGYGNMKGSTGNNSYGNCVKIDHENGYCTLYAHMQKGLLVKNGDYVKKGQRLGYMSDSGNAYGGHLHFEVWKNGTRINPTEYLDKDLFTEQVNKYTEELANEVIQGLWGNGQDRKNRLGDRYSEVQARVNEILTPVPKPSVDILDLVKKTIRGDFGNGDDRKNNLGSYYNEVQRQVNLNYQNGTINWDNIRLY